MSTGSPTSSSAAGQLSGQFVASERTADDGVRRLQHPEQRRPDARQLRRLLAELRRVHEEDGLVWYFTPEERAKFSTPAPGEFSNIGRNYFRGPGGYFINLSLSKRTRIVGSQILEIRADGTNVTNHPVFGFPTLTTTSADVRPHPQHGHQQFAKDHAGGEVPLLRRIGRSRMAPACERAAIPRDGTVAAVPFLL